MKKKTGRAEKKRELIDSIWQLWIWQCGIQSLVAGVAGVPVCPDRHAAWLSQKSKRGQSSVFLTKRRGYHRAPLTLQLNKGIELVNSGRLTEALAEFDGILKVAPNVVEARLGRGTTRALR